jgi:hypothetical protein
LVAHGVSWTARSAGNDRAEPGRSAPGRPARLVGFSAAVLMLAGVAGCGASGDPLPPADDPVAWAGRLCSAMVPLAAIRNGTPRVDPNDPAATRDSLSRFFSSATDRADQAIIGLRAAGPSPTRAGAQAARRLDEALHRARAAYAQARDRIERVNPGDPFGMGTQLPAILRDLTAATADPQFGAMGIDPVLSSAIKQAPSCALLPGHDATG